MLEAVCPNGHRLQVPLEHAGMKLRCPAPGCGVIFQLSATSPTGSTLAVGPSTSGPNLPSTAPAPNTAAAPAPAPAPAAAQQPQSSQTYGTQPLAPAPAAPRTTAAAGPEPRPRRTSARAAGAASQSGPQAAGPPLSAPIRNAGPRSVDLSGGALLAGAQAILMLGLVLVLTRAVATAWARNVTRLKAKYTHEQQAFEAKFQEADKAFLAELDDDKLNEKAKTDLTKKRNDAATAHSKERTANAAAWAQMLNAADDAATSHMMWGYWREMMFVVGTILLSLGLTAVAFVGQGVERYLCFGLLAIIVFSVYVGGAAWFTSIVGGLSGMVPGR